MEITHGLDLGYLEGFLNRKVHTDFIQQFNLIELLRHGGYSCTAMCVWTVSKSFYSELIDHGSVSSESFCNTIATFG
jgi:hypothetical protein